MGWISLKGISLHCPIGYYEKERIEGNDFIIDISVWVDTKNSGNSDILDDTLDYQCLYDTVEKTMSRPAKLIEHAGHSIAEEIIEEFRQVQAVRLSIAKLNPPIKGACEKAVFELEVER